MELTWLDAQQPDPGDVDGAVAMCDAAYAFDTPDAINPTPGFFIAELQHGWDGDPPSFAVMRDKRNRVVGVLGVSLPHRDNTHLGFLDITVDPAARRQGIGRQLFEAGVDRVRAEGRRLVLTDSYDRPGCVAFALEMGLQRAAQEMQRRQNLVSIDWEHLDRQFELAQQSAAGYELIRLSGPTPDEMLDAVVRMTAAINDAPIDDLEVEDEVFTPERVRSFESGQARFGRRVYRVVAVHRESGELAGHTLVAVVNDRPGFAFQYDTSVVRSHRGHRLGVLLKLDMLRWLGEVEPQLRTLDTWNAASNEHMIEVNELLGYRVQMEAIAWQKPVA